VFDDPDEGISLQGQPNLIRRWGNDIRGVIGIMKRTLELPFDIIQPIIPGEKGKEHQRGE
jgi:hypothetical protein